MNLEDMIFRCESLGQEKLRKPCQLRIQSYSGNDPDKKGWWCADLITYATSDPMYLDYSQVYGEWDTAIGAIEDLIHTLEDVK
ncbi:MAG: hypothetical protein EB127_10240 [Alphaproteobacteria bacterium]|nr:hypothetical protein [Alphaproteobacteria bacterium]